MPLPYQIVPEGSLKRPKIETHINDNTEVITNPAMGGGPVTSCLCVFASPKGRDREVITIKDGQAAFLDEFGLGPFSLYGQPLMNAYAAATAATTSDAMVHCLRVTPEDAAYSCATLIAKYAFTDNGTMLLHFVIKPSDTDLLNLEDLETATKVDEVNADVTGYTSVKLFSLAYRGRGSYGKNIRFRITTDKATDKMNEFKNYNFMVYRNEDLLEQKENFNVVVVPDALYSGMTIFLEDVINDSEDGSNYLRIVAFPDGFQKLYDLYKNENPDTPFTLNDFDPLLGIDKWTRNAIPNLEIEAAEYVEAINGETPVDLSSATGIALLGGHDGSLDEMNPDRETVLNALYLRAYSQQIDPRIKSRNRYPTTFIFDANFPIQVKLAIASLVTQRTDCVGVLDFGLQITTKAGVGAYYNDNFANIIDSRYIYYEPYCMKVRDPYTKKTVTVTSTYWMSQAYLTHINAYNGKHRPMAGNTLGIISGYVGQSVYPVFDEDLDETMMDEYADLNLNIAKYNQNQVIVRAMQNSAQAKLSALTEMNNVLVLLDVKRDCERLCAYYEYDFMEADDIARFNTDVANVVARYADGQVRSISAHFDKNSWEAERSIIHLYVEMVMKDLVKTTIIEIDVNRSDG